jgi:hypothetical protein
MFRTMSFASLRLAALLLLPLLAACTISSDALLVTDADLAYPLPESFALTPYKFEDEVFRPDADEAPRPFALRDGAYWSDEGSMALRFVKRPDGDYIIAVSGPDREFLYGRAETDGALLIIQMVIGNDEDLPALLAAADADPAMADLTDAISMRDGGLVVSSLAALDQVIDWIADGSIEANPLVAFIGADATTPPPDRIRHTGQGWTLN